MKKNEDRDYLIKDRVNYLLAKDEYFVDWDRLGLDRFYYLHGWALVMPANTNESVEEERREGSVEVFVKGYVKLKEAKVLSFGPFPDVYQIMSVPDSGHFGLTKQKLEELVENFWPSFFWDENTVPKGAADTLGGDVLLVHQITPGEYRSPWFCKEQVTEFAKSSGIPIPEGGLEENLPLSMTTKHQPAPAEMKTRERNTLLKIIGSLSNWLNEADQLEHDKPYKAAEQIVQYADSKGKKIGSTQTIAAKLKDASEEWSNSDSN